MKNEHHYQRQQKGIISIDEGLAIISENIPVCRRMECSLEEGIGRYLATDIVAPEPSPRYTNSAMDGFAVRWQDVLHASAENPVELRIVGESQAGTSFSNSVGSGEAIRISTGAVVPNDCDTVIRVEDTEEQNGSVIVHAVRSAGQDVRYMGEEFTAGELLLQKGIHTSSEVSVGFLNTSSAAGNKA